MAATGVGSIPGVAAVCIGAAGTMGISTGIGTRAAFTDAGGTVNAVSVLELEVQPDTPRQAIKIAEAAAKTRM